MRPDALPGALPDALPEVLPGALPTGRPLRHLTRAVLSVLVAAALLFFVFPRVVGTTVTDVRATFTAVSLRDAALLSGLWAAGLLAHSFVLTGALPGLTRRRALTLNLTGSAVSNVLPFGGAAGMSMNYVMIRSWGVDASGFAAFTLVTNACVVLFKLVMPTLALVGLLLVGGPVTTSTRWTALASVGVLTMVVLLLFWGLASRRATEWASDAITPLWQRLARLLHRPGDPIQLRTAVLACRDTVASVLARHWRGLTSGTLGYGLLQVVLLWACVHAVGGQVAPAVVVAGYAVDRVLTLVVITPGGTGFTEAGTAAALVALGGAPATMAAGVLLYRGFTFALEIPVGGLWLGGWWWWRRRARGSREGRR